jgi:UDP-N-acetylmuramate dehydrogenase
VLTGQCVVSRFSNKEIKFGYRQTEIRDGVLILSAEHKLIHRKQKDIASDIRNNLAYRRRRQPTGYSAGSYFKNIKGYATGKLIEDCGLKGLSVGDAEISRKHGNFIINRGYAKASDVLKLANIIKKRVTDTTGILLKEEVRLLK